MDAYERPLNGSVGPFSSSMDANQTQYLL